MISQSNKMELCKTLTLPENKINKATQKVAQAAKNNFPNIDHLFVRCI
jgi:hypothetical protein